MPLGIYHITSYLRFLIHTLVTPYLCLRPCYCSNSFYSSLIVDLSPPSSLLAAFSKSAAVRANCFVMGLQSEEYRLLQDSEECINEKSIKSYRHHDCPSARHTLHKIILIALLFLSLASNVILLLAKTTGSQKEEGLTGHTIYGDLSYDQSKPFVAYSEYSSENFTQTDALWEAIDFDDGLVALPKEWTDAKGLPQTATYPWDESKGIWLLNGYHGLHCTKRIYISLMEYRKGLPQSLPPRHIFHCLDSLREQVMCDADDTPRFTHSKNEESGHITGMHQKRQCRDWSKLENWARQYNSCYRYGDPTWDKGNQFRRFMFCKEDSPYLPAVREFFGKPDDWVPFTDADFFEDE